MPINLDVNKEVILIVGGAGYVGSHMAWLLQQQGYMPIVLDNFSTGQPLTLSNVEFIHGDMADKEKLQWVFSRFPITAVMHFAAHIDIAESIRQPGKYYRNNVMATLNLLEVMLINGVKKIIFSSTAAVYGDPLYTPIDEIHILNPTNPYGRSKRMVEEIIQDYGHSNYLQYAILRYFNAAGAHPEGLLGENHEPETHLIPLLLQVAAGVQDIIMINGDDYQTTDGTCIRDYVHVLDICEAHMLALRWLSQSQPALICNVGTGMGHSVSDVINVVRQVTQHPIPTRVVARRIGDPAVLVADADKARRILHWYPRYKELETIVQHAWRYYQTHAITKVADPV